MLARFLIGLGNLGAALVQESPPVGCDEPLTFFNENGERGFRVARDRKIRRRVRLEVLDIAFHEQVQGRDGDQLGISADASSAALHFKIQEQIRLACSVTGQRMPVGNMHAFSAIVDGGLQHFRKFRDQLHTVGSPRRPPAVDSRVLRRNQHFGGFSDGVDLTAWRC